MGGDFAFFWAALDPSLAGRGQEQEGGVGEDIQGGQCDKMDGQDP